MVTVPSATDQQRVLLRYNNVAIAIHWLTVPLVVTQLFIGFVFVNMARGADRTEWFT